MTETPEEEYRRLMARGTDKVSDDLINENRNRLVNEAKHASRTRAKRLAFHRKNKRRNRRR